MYTLPGSPRIALSPWSLQASDPDEIAALNARAEALGVEGVSTIKRRDRKWMARAFDREYAHVHSFIGATLTGAIVGVLDAFEASQQGFTPDELVQIANQSGMDVTRA